MVQQLQAAQLLPRLEHHQENSILLMVGLLLIQAEQQSPFHTITVKLQTSHCMRNGATVGEFRASRLLVTRLIRVNRLIFLQPDIPELGTFHIQFQAEIALFGEMS
jgi:hypothetical protein